MILRPLVSLLSRWYRLTGRLYLRLQGVRTGPGSSVLGYPIVSRAPSSSIVVGNHTVLCSTGLFTALGVNHRVVLRTLRRGAQIVIGNDVGLSGTAICAASRIEIGDEALIGANVVIADTDFHPLDPLHRRYNNSPSDIRCKPVCLERNVFIGAGAIVLKGVTIGENSVIGAGSVVTNSIPRNSVAAGNPCRVVRKLPCPKTPEAPQ